MKNKGLSVFWRVFALVLGLCMLLPTSVVGVTAEERGISENYALGKPVSTNSEYGSYPKEAAVDGSSQSYWRTFTGKVDTFVYFIVSLEAETEINLIRMKLFKETDMDFIALQYTTAPNPLDESLGESAWLDIEIFEKDQISSEMNVSFDALKATGVRFYADVSAKLVGLYELEVYYAEDSDSALEDLSRQTYYEFVQPTETDAKIVSVGENGELIYADYDGKGAKLLDFSYAGYRNGTEPIPDVKVVKTIEAGDLAYHTTLIQNAINEVSALPEAERGAILLKAGKYTVTNQLKIAASGVVLRGEGQGENGTIIYDARTKTNGITLRVEGSDDYTAISKTNKKLTSTYVPVGETTVEVAEAGVYNVGGAVAFVCTPNDLWLQTIGMDRLSGTGEPWKLSDFIMTYERTVTAVDAAKNTITIDVGIPITLDSKYYSVMVLGVKDHNGRISECGVENIRFVSYYNGDPEDENHAFRAIQFKNCRNCWARDVSAKHYAVSTVSAAEGSINITVEGCSYLEPVSTVSGGKRYSFYMAGGQYVLMKNCYSQNARHDYVVSSKVEGPNVFLNCVAENSYSSSEPHHRWSNGSLYDNIFQIGISRLGAFAVVNAGNNGSGHGWQGATTIFWNCLSPAIGVGKPQTEQNFAIGVYGVYKNTSKVTGISFYKYRFVEPSIVTPNYPEFVDYENSPIYGNAYVEAPCNLVNPSSLYKAQLSYRLYGDATKNVTPIAPILKYPATDSKIETREVSFSGICNNGAEKVYVWIDGEKHSAEISADNSYSLTLALKNGYHDIQVTQVVGGAESEPNAERTVFVESDEPYVEPPKQNDNTSASQNSSLGVIIAVSAIACVAVGACVFFVVKNFKKK